MSFHQSKNDKNDADYRKSGQSSSFNQQRNSSGAYGRGGGGPGPITSTRRLVRVYKFERRLENSAFLILCVFKRIVKSLYTIVFLFGNQLMKFSLEAKIKYTH